MRGVNVNVFINFFKLKARLKKRRKKSNTFLNFSILNTENELNLSDDELRNWFCALLEIC